MEKIKLDLSKVKGFVSEQEIEETKARVKDASNKIIEKSGKGNEFLGWVNLPENYDKEEYERIKKAAQRIRRDSELLIVIGIGGSYLGARAVIESLGPSFYGQNSELEVLFAGQNLSGKYLSDLIRLIKEKEISVNVISKSGTTTEPAIAFRIIKKLMEEKYGKEKAKERIFATTDKENGALRKLAEAEGYETFTIPDNIGGRYSVLTAVGLLPIAAAGIDTDQLICGAREGLSQCSGSSLENDSMPFAYAAVRDILYKKGKKIEILAVSEPSFTYLAEWWKQLFGESEGKEGKGIFPSSALFTTDLHSLGQYIQEGERLIFETFLNIEKKSPDIQIENQADNSDELNYLAGKGLNEINQVASEATKIAHQNGGVPNLAIKVPELTPYYLGQLLYLFEYACALSAYTLGVNPFNQPGVEEYKKKMFSLLQKPGY